MRRVYTPGFGAMSFEVAPPELESDLDEVLQQALTRNMGWDAVAHLWRPILVDSAGATVSSNRASNVRDFSSSSASLTTIDTQIVTPNTNRVGLRIFNFGTEVVFLYPSNPVAIGTAWPIRGGDVFSLELYPGSVWARTETSTAVVRMLELFG